MIAGGGTAGHINPGIAIAKYIKTKIPQAEIVFVGTEKGMENTLVPREGFKLQTICVRGFKRKISLDNIKVVRDLIKGLAQSRKLLRQFKPDVVIGTGGYVCGPLVYSAAKMKIPTLIHEQNAFPGITNKILSRVVDTVAISFKESEKYFKKKKKLVYTGNPVRYELLLVDKKTAREKLSIDPQKKLVVVTGGSLGAKTINHAVVDMILQYDLSQDFDLILSTGNSQFEEIIKKIGSQPKGVKVLPYIYDAANTYVAADVMVCRSGAITCSELTALGIPSITIPFPFAAENHQEYNARALEKQGASIVLLDKEVEAGHLYQQLKGLLAEEQQLKTMATNAKKMSVSRADEKIFVEIQRMLCQ